jgi:hypothetical protein
MPDAHSMSEARTQTPAHRGADLPRLNLSHSPVSVSLDSDR